MKIKPYIDKLSGSKEFKEFRNMHKDAFLTAGFFVLDFENGKNMHQIDYYIPSEKKVAAFTLDHNVSLQILDTLSGVKAPQKLDINTNIDLDALAGILQDEMKNRSITEDIKKIIAILQTIDGKKIWNLNCVLSGMEILRAHVEDDTKTVLKMDRSSVLDYIKKIPSGALKKTLVNSGSKPDLKKEMEKLDQLEKAIEKEKVEIKKQMETKTKDKKADNGEPKSKKEVKNV